MKPSPFKRPVRSGDADTVQELLREIKQLKRRVAYLESLDRYDQEWITFTPTVAGLTTAGSFTYATRTGSYTRIGDTVILRVYINISTVSVAGSGSTAITGLPYASVGDFGCGSDLTANLSAGYTSLSAYVQNATTRIIINEIGDGIRQSFPAASIDGSFFARIIAVYQAESD